MLRLNGRGLGSMGYLYYVWRHAHGVILLIGRAYAVSNMQIQITLYRREFVRFKN